MIEPGDPLPDLAIDVYDSSGVLAAGGAVSVTIYRDGVAVASSPGTLTISNPSTGRYTTAYTATTAGVYVVVWTITGANAGVTSTSYNVSSPAVGIISLLDAKRYLRVNRTTDDDLLTALILQASDLCEGPEGTGITWRRTVVTGEVHSVRSSGRVSLNKPGAGTVTAITVDGVAGVPADYPIDAGMISVSGSSVTISYVVGGGVIPDGVIGGVLELVRHLYAPQRGGTGPKQDDVEMTAGYLIPNRVLQAWRANSGVGF